MESDSQHAGWSKPLRHRGNGGTGIARSAGRLKRNNTRRRPSSSRNRRDSEFITPHCRRTRITAARTVQRCRGARAAGACLALLHCTATMANNWSKAHHQSHNHCDGRETPHGIILSVLRCCLRYEKLNKQKLSGPPNWRGPNPLQPRLNRHTRHAPRCGRSAKTQKVLSFHPRAQSPPRGFFRKELEARS